MKLYHATTRANLASILEHGLRVVKADPTAKIKGVWACTASNRGWAILHTQRKHKALLEDVVVIEINVPKNQLTRFKRGFFYSKTDIGAERVNTVIPGEHFGRSLSE